nr:uncharacterized protein LOC129282636 [Lytechinus pictus]
MLFEAFNPLFLLAIVLLLCGIGITFAPFATTVLVLGMCISTVGISMGVLDTGANLVCLRMWGKKRSGTMLQALHFSFALGAFFSPLLAAPFLVDTSTTGNMVATPSTLVPPTVTVTMTEAIHTMVNEKFTSSKPDDVTTGVKPDDDTSNNNPNDDKTDTTKKKRDGRSTNVKSDNGSNDVKSNNGSTDVKSNNGRTTGIIQLILGIVIVVVNVLTFVYGHMGYPNEGSPIGIGIFFAIPSGIIGITSKSRRNCVIIAYLVMSVLSTVSGFGGVVTEGLAAGVFSYEYVCFYTFCYLDTFDVAIILHAVGAVLLLVESIVAIVASVYCCRGLKCCQGCCCHGDDTGNPRGNSSATPGVTATSVHYPQPQGVVAYSQPETFVVKTTTPV